MKRICLLFISLMHTAFIFGQAAPTPDKLWGDLFKEVQLKRVFPDNKTFVDCTPKAAPNVILRKYRQQKKSADFVLRDFVLEHFDVPVVTSVKVTEGLQLKEHLEQLWDLLSRKADDANKNRYSSLLPLPHPYIIPGGRFREIYYWDSYFTMQGLAVSKRYDLIESMVKNFKYLIDTYGHIPNGNRNYYLGRSQPPYFAMMVEVLQKHKGDSVLLEYRTSMETEYDFWMDGVAHLKQKETYRRVVRMPDGSVLNRHWDDVNAPRQESYAEDIATNEKYTGNDGKAYVNLRASAESGWDFSSRWFRDSFHLNTIETTDIVPVDLNCLLYAYEKILARANELAGKSKRAEELLAAAEKRKAAVMKYCWNNDLKYFFDYDLVEKHTTNRWSIAGVMPLFNKLCDSATGLHVRDRIAEKFVKDGGVLSTLYNTGEQWDAPNGWPPLQFLAVRGLLNYGHNDLARTIAERWMRLNERIFASTGKMLEKYNIENISLESGGGEYPTQDGFGWTNGVYLAFDDLFPNKNPNSSPQARIQKRSAAMMATK
jgi:alpha,alpha-trehalase